MPSALVPLVLAITWPLPSSSMNSYLSLSANCSTIRRSAKLRLAAVRWAVPPLYTFSCPLMEENRRYMLCCTPS